MLRSDQLSFRPGVKLCWYNRSLSSTEGGLDWPDSTMCSLKLICGFAFSCSGLTRHTCRQTLKCLLFHLGALSVDSSCIYGLKVNWNWINTNCCGKDVTTTTSWKTGFSCFILSFLFCFVFSSLLTGSEEMVVYFWGDTDSRMMKWWKRECRTTCAHRRHKCCTLVELMVKRLIYGQTDAALAHSLKFLFPRVEASTNEWLNRLPGLDWTVYFSVTHTPQKEILTTTRITSKNVLCKNYAFPF